MKLPEVSGRSAARTAVLQAGGKLLLLLLALAATAVVTRAIGIDRYADWATVLTLVSLLGFALDPGFGPVVVRRLSSQSDAVPRPRDMLVLQLALAAVAYGLVVALSGVLAGSRAAELGLVLGAQLLPRAVVLNTSTWLQAHHRVHVQTALELVTSGLGLVGLLVGSLVGLRAGCLAAVGVVGPLLLLAAVGRRQLREVDLVNAVPGGSAVREVLREALPMMLGVSLVAVYTRIDIVWVTQAEDARGLAQYLLGYRFIEQVIVVSGIVGATAFPLIVARGGDESIFRDPVVHDLITVVLVLGATVSLSLIVVARPLVGLVGGDEFRPGSTLLVLLAPTALLVFGNFILGYAYAAARVSRKYVTCSASGFAFTIFAGVIFTSKFGAPAAARVTWMTELCVVCVASRPFLTREAGARTMVLRATVMVAAVVGASEAVAAGAPPLLVVLVGCLAVAGAAGPGAVRTVRGIGGGRGS